jgi:chromatin structure-remodeling complex subunit RSC1/2
MQISTPATYHEQYATPNRTSFSASQPAAAQHRYAPMPVLPGGRQADAFILNDLQNAQIPEDVRKEFLQDDTGHVLFFTKPPLATLPAERVTKLGGHTIKYMASKLRRQLEAKMQREDAEVEEAGGEQSSRSPKRRRLNNDDDVQPNGTRSALDVVKAAADKSFEDFIHDMNAGTAAILSAMQPGMDVTQLQIANLERAEAGQMLMMEEQEALRKSANERKMEAERKARELWQEPKVYLDDLDPGF